MNRRAFLAACAGAPAVIAAPRRPNFVLIMTDDHGYHDLGCQGAADLKTPHIDRLAAGGARFTDWYSLAPMCAPSRAALLTGRYPIRAGVPANGPELPASEVTLAALLQDHGYRTGLTGKWHLSLPPAGPNARGFDYFYGFHSGCVDFYSHRYYWNDAKTPNYHDLYRNSEEIFEDGRYLTERIAEEAVGFLERSKERPFFLYVPFNAPHYPMHAPERYVKRFPGLAPERQMYAAMLAAVDDGVGAILDTLGRLGLRENTLVVFTSDNGATREPRAGMHSKPVSDGGRNDPLRGFKFSLFEGGIRLPAVLNWPGRIPAGRVVREMCAHFDLFPTFAALAGARPNGVIDGRDIFETACGNARSPHPELFWASSGQTAARRGRWKLVLDGLLAEDGGFRRGTVDSVFLSDLEADIGESRNLAGEHPDLVAELRAAAEKWHAGSSAPDPYCRLM